MKKIVKRLGKQLVSTGERNVLRLSKQLLSAGETTALTNLLLEFKISKRHRNGLRWIEKNHEQSPKRINLGSGSVKKPDFLNIDLFPGGDVMLDLRRGLPFATSGTEFIFSEHFIEHVQYPDTVELLLSECLRVLVPGGKFRFSVPDTEVCIKDYSKGPNSEYFKACMLHKWHPAYCTTMIEHINYHFRQSGEHLFAYDEETARKLLSKIGFVNIHRVEFDAVIDSKHREDASLFRIAEKPK
jgi:predicted SAM-dependent methyltransferase